MEVIDSTRRGPQAIFTVRVGDTVKVITREELTDEAFKNWRRKQARECMQRNRANKKNADPEANVSDEHLSCERMSEPTNKKRPRQVSNQQESAKTSKSEGTQADDEVGDRAISMITCKVCRDAEVKKLLMPCGHLAICAACLKRTMAIDNRCPICRAKIKDHFGAFLIA